MLTIHGRINSINVQKVALACEELKLPYVRHDAGGAFGIVQTPGYKAMNPNSLVPVLIDGDLVLWESNTIVRYLAAKHGRGTLWPEDAGQRALSDRWMDWQAFSFGMAYAAAFRGLIKRDLSAGLGELRHVSRKAEMVDREAWNGVIRLDRVGLGGGMHTK